MQLLEEEDSADDEFWNQDFFQEEKADVDYQSESSEATSADEDFSEPVGNCLEPLISKLHTLLQPRPFSATTQSCTSLYIWLAAIVSLTCMLLGFCQFAYLVPIAVMRVLGSDEERQFEGTAMDQTKAVPLETSTPLNAWLLTSALSSSTLSFDKYHLSRLVSTSTDSTLGGLHAGILRVPRI